MAYSLYGPERSAIVLPRNFCDSKGDVQPKKQVGVTKRDPRPNQILIFSPAHVRKAESTSFDIRFVDCVHSGNQGVDVPAA